MLNSGNGHEPIAEEADSDERDSNPDNHPSKQISGRWDDD